MGRFWMDNDFIREDAKNLSLKAIAVFVSLSSRCNKYGVTFVGYRRVALDLGINKDTVMKAVKELEAYGLIGRSVSRNGRVSEIVIKGVQKKGKEPSSQSGPKEVFKEDNKEESYKKLLKEKHPEDYERLYGNN